MEIQTGSSQKNSPLPADQVQTGFNALNANAFMKLLITQLQNQDPTEPVGNEELLNQLSMMRNLQSNIELSDAMKSITSGQQLSTAASFIGQQVKGSGADGSVEGVVDRVTLRGGKVYLGVGNRELTTSQIESVLART